MNKTAIEWTDFTFNPVTGCWGPGGTAETPNRCPYCYAAKIAHRMAHVEGSGYGHGVDSPNPTGAFNPTFHPDRLDQPAKVKKPSKIFVCSMADLFGDWVPSQWIRAVLEVADNTPQHIFQFLTKNPKRLSQWNGFWPKNCWVGTTVTNQADADERLPWLLRVNAPVIFISHEPLLSPIDVKSSLGVMPDSKINWAIIGAMTGPGAVKVEPAWVINLEYQYQQAGVPIFEKNNLSYLCGPGAKLVQEFPK